MSCHVFFFFNDTATTEIYTLSLHDALPISSPGPCDDHVGTTTRRDVVRAVRGRPPCPRTRCSARRARDDLQPASPAPGRSEEHTSELQSRQYLVCRLLLEKKKKHHIMYINR